jgi:hypothetical protein
MPGCYNVLLYGMLGWNVIYRWLACPGQLVQDNDSVAYSEVYIKG